MTSGLKITKKMSLKSFTEKPAKPYENIMCCDVIICKVRERKVSQAHISGESYGSFVFMFSLYPTGDL